MPVLVGIDAGATKSVAIAVDPDGTRRARVVGEGANPKRHGLDIAADRLAALACDAAPQPDLVFVAGAGIDRPEHARSLEGALSARLPRTRVVVVNDTLAVLRAATPDAVGLVVPVSTGGNVIGRGPDGRVTDRGHGIYGGGYVLGALAARAARRGLDPAGRGRADPAGHSRIDTGLARAIEDADLVWHGRRPAPEAAHLGAAVAEAAERGDPLASRMVDRWCNRVRDAVREEVIRLGLGPAPAVIVFGGLADASPWLAARIRAAVVEAAAGARLVTLEVEPAEGAADLALDAWRGAPIAWDFAPRR